MLKVVIADDEARVCSLIQMLIDWDALDMELAGTAANGLEALELVRAQRPDILITDIRMPGCHGLELIERAKQENPALGIVIISGYAHFEYAQSAIRFGVGDYLLKPINRQELMATLQKLAERCRQLSRSASEVEALRRSSLEDQQQLQSRLIQDLMAGRLTDASPEHLWEAYRFRAEGGLVQLALLTMDYAPGRFSAASLPIIGEKAEKLFETELSSLCRSAVMRFEEGVGAMLLCFEAGQLKAVRQRLRGCLNQLQAQQAMFGHVEFSLAVSPASEDPTALPRAFETAALTAKERLTEGTGRMLEKLPAASGADYSMLLAPWRAVMESHQLDVQRATQAANALEAQVRTARGMRGAEIDGLVLEAARILLSRPDIAGREGKLAAFRAECRHAGRVDRLFDALRTLAACEIELLLEQQRNGATRPIRVARQYVQQHYSEPITLEQVCEAAGFSASYFSALFKKETGEGFVKYLTRVRMEHAKELLQQTNLPVAEICTRVGYNDLKHFTQTFKKETSLSPGQYRKLYG